MFMSQLSELVDTGANVHVCADKSVFVSYQAAAGRSVTMGNFNDCKGVGDWTRGSEVSFRTSSIFTQSAPCACS